MRADQPQPISWDLLVLVGPVVLAIAWTFIVILRMRCAEPRDDLAIESKLSPVCHAGMVALGICGLFIVFFVFEVVLLLARPAPDPY